jgi:arsenate reductase (thioredoxin)
MVARETRCPGQLAEALAPLAVPQDSRVIQLQRLASDVPALEPGRGNNEPQGKGIFTAYSAGSRPAEQPHPEALKQIESAGIPIEGLRSKTWDEFAGDGSPQMHFVFTVCDNAAKQVSPHWPGQPMTAHWGVPDPEAAGGSTEEIARAFHDAFVVLDRRIGLFIALPFSALKEAAIKGEIERIGHT